MKFVEITTREIGKKEDINYDLVQCCVFGLGLLAQGLPQGQFTQLGDTVNFITYLCNPATAEINETSYMFMVDNAVSALAKIIIF